MANASLALTLSCPTKSENCFGVIGGRLFANGPDSTSKAGAVQAVFRRLHLPGKAGRFDNLPGQRDIPCGMPRFNQQNAAEMQKRSFLARLAREERERDQRVKLAEMPADAHESALKERVYAQLHRLDDLIDATDDLKQLVLLIHAKVKLWGLVIPTAGVLKHRHQRRPAFVPRVWDAGAVDV